MDYWPAEFKILRLYKAQLFASQKKTIAFVLRHKRAFVLSEMGTGKTRAAAYGLYILWWRYTHRYNKPFRALIVAPLSTLDAVWGAELKSVAGGSIPVYVATGPIAKRCRNIEQMSDGVVVTNYHALGAMYETLRTWRPDLLIIDESAMLRNPNTLWHKALMRLANGTGRVPPPWSTAPLSMTWVWALTGAPTPNAPTDAWGQMAVVRPREAGYFGAWRNKTMVAVQRVGKCIFSYAPKPDADKLVHAYLQPAIRYTREQVVDLPPSTTSRRFVPLPAKRRRLLDELRRQAAIVVDKSRITAANAAVVVGKALQIALGTVIDDEGEVQILDATERYAVVAELIDEAAAKVLVFAAYRAAIERLADYLADRSSASAVAVVHGDVGLSERTELFASFQEPSDPLRVIVAHPGSMAHGLTLTEASTIVWLGPVWSADLYTQACARIHRPGQVRPCHIVQIYGCELEARAYNVLERRLTLQDAILGLYEKIVDSNEKLW